MIQTKFTKLFKCKIPILGAPMAGVSGGLLASTTTNAHACGLIAGGYLDNLEKLN